jgi:hypothetical protein
MTHISVRLGYYYTHQQLIKALSPLFSAQPGETVKINLDLNPPSGFIYPDYLLLIIGAVRFAQEVGAIVTGTCVCHPNCKTYVSRINFFENLGISFDEHFTRRSSSGRFLEINRFGDHLESNRHADNVITILREKGEFDNTLLAALSLSLGEVLGNVFDHSRWHEGWLVAQHYEKLKKLRVMIVDTGRGIHTSLTDKPKNSAYRLFSPEQALQQCIVKGVTNGTGMGNGLYVTANFLRENGGVLMIHSGSHVLQITNRKETIEPAPFWQGTVVYLEINSNISVSPELINDGRTEFMDTFDEWITSESESPTNDDIGSLW